MISQLAIFTDADRIQELRAAPGGQLDGHGLAVGRGGAPAALQGEEWGILIEELELGVRSYNCLKRAGIQTVGDLISKSEAELNAIPNFGKKSIDEVIETLHARGLTCARTSAGPTRLRRPCATRRHETSSAATQRHRKALLMNLSKEIIEHERIKTTEAKAKAVKPEIEKLITLAKRGDLHARRQALSTLAQDKFAVHKLFEEVAPRYADRPGGYTRILKLGPRRSDATEMVFIELV